MALPQDGQDANGLTKVTQIPAGKELMFIDPTTNEGGIITLEDLTKQILNGLTSQIFALDAGQKTIIQALNTLNSDSFPSFCAYGGTYEITSRLAYNTYIVFGMYDLDAIFSIITVNGDATPALKEFASTGYIRAELVSTGKFNLILRNTSVAARIIAMDSCTIVNKG